MPNDPGFDDDLAGRVEHALTGEAARVEVRPSRKVLKPGEFNQVFVRCVGKRVTIKINGLTTVDKQFPEIAARGVIGWQVHRGNVGEIVFKDIEFKELP